MKKEGGVITGMLKKFIQHRSTIFDSIQEVNDFQVKV